MSAWTADRLPITVPPRPGEALESWIGAYARRLRTTGHDLMAHLGLGGTRITQMAGRLHEHEAAILKRATGVSGQDLTAMTLERYDGLVIATEPGRRRDVPVAGRPVRQPPRPLLPGLPGARRRPRPGHLAAALVVRLPAASHLAASVA